MWFVEKFIELILMSSNLGYNGEYEWFDNTVERYLWNKQYKKELNTNFHAN